MSRSKVTFKAMEFDGEASLLDFFFTQIKTLAKAHKWTNEETIHFLGSKLTGAARTYFTQNPSIYKSNDLNDVEREFKAFFAPMSKTAALVEFNNLMLLPQETIRNFAHRLNILTDKVHNTITDNHALNNIKFTKFISCIPSRLRIKIQEEEIEDYKTAVTRAQTLQDISLNEQILQSCPVSSSADSITKQLQELSQKINTLTFDYKKNDEKEQQIDDRDYGKQSNFSQRGKFYKTRHYDARDTRPFNYRAKQSNPPITCQLCFKQGHDAINCFKWKRMNTKRNNNQYYRNGNNYNRKRDNEHLN